MIRLYTLLLLQLGFVHAWAADNIAPDETARRYVALVKSLENSGIFELDFTFGQAEHISPAYPPGTSLDTLANTASSLEAEINSSQDQSTTLAVRLGFLSRFLQHQQLQTSTNLQQEYALLYGRTLPVEVRSDTADLLLQLDRLLPGTGPLVTRLRTFQNRTLIPRRLRRTVFETALQECRRRTLLHWKLPPEETIELKWLEQQATPWHRYLGNYRSQLQISAAAVAFPSAALDVACHEGYPGHHAQFVHLEHSAGRNLSLPMQVVMLRAPDSLFREGAAELGSELAFTPDERLAFERDVLYPLAGLDPTMAQAALQVRAILRALSDNIPPLLALYSSGGISRMTARIRLETEALVNSGEQLLQYADNHGAYSLSYVTERNHIAGKLESTAENIDQQWLLLAQWLVEATHQPGNKQIR
jgi:hypothetical protein